MLEALPYLSPFIVVLLVILWAWVLHLRRQKYLGHRRTTPSKDWGSHDGGAPAQHASDCAVHNAPALPPGPCDCDESEKPTKDA
jgi:NADH:ubiquinone oxidoreductase subunit 3 (subunit A)